jgi:hypothetical protein
LCEQIVDCDRQFLERRCDAAEPAAEENRQSRFGIAVLEICEQLL